MTLSPRPDTTFADLLRLVAGWLVLVVALQSLQWATTLGAGPRHRHAGVASPSATDRRDPAHEHAHLTAQRHHHGLALPGLTVDADERERDEALERAAFALAAAFALLAFAHTLRLSPRVRHVLRAGLPAAWRSTPPRPPRRPPRAA